MTITTRPAAPEADESSTWRLAALPTPVLPLRSAAPLAVAAGLLLDAAFPGANWWPLAFVALAMLLLLVRGRRLVTGYGLGVLFGLGFFVPLLQWSGIYVGPLPWLALATLQALLLALIGPLWVAAWRLAERASWTLPLTAALAWLVVEGLRARWPFGGFSWGRLGFSQADSPLLGLSAAGGVPLLSGGVVAVAAVLALLALQLPRLRRSLPADPRVLADPQVPADSQETAHPQLPADSSASGQLGPPPEEQHEEGALALGGRATAPSPVAVGVTAAVTLGVVAALTAGGLLASRAAASGDATVRVGAVQGNVPAPGLDFNAERRAVLDNHATTTEGLAMAVADDQVAPVDLVVWPENSSDIDPLRNADADAAISRATDAVQVPVLVGAVLQEPEGNLTNAMLVWEPGSGYRGDADGRYAKQEPAPFAEYIPYRDFFRFFSPFVDEVTDFVPGPGPATFEVGGAVVGPVICFEVAEDHVVRGQVDAGADLLAVPTNNATFGFSDESVQQLAMSRVRAVEHGRSVVHISTVGVSALITPDGRTGERTELFTRDVLVGELPLATGRTPAAVVGFWPELAAGIAAVALLLTGIVLGRGSRRPDAR